MSKTSICVSIVSPMYNEQDNVRHFVDQVSKVMRDLKESYEIILVDDGSRDDTWEEIVATAKDFKEIVGVNLSRNFGHQGALLAGLHQARGKAVITIDGDLQHPPESIPKLIESWRNGAKIVLTHRMDKEKVTKFKRFTSKHFYHFFSSISETAIKPGNSDYRLMDRQAMEELLRLRYGKPFLRGAVNTLGFKTDTVDYEIGLRFSGSSAYTLPKMIRFAMHGLISHSSVPLRAGIYLGIVTGFLSLLELFYVLIQVFRGITVAGWASTLGVISLLFSVLFVILGVIGLYLEDIHCLLKEKPHFIIADVIGPQNRQHQNITDIEG